MCYNLQHKVLLSTADVNSLVDLSPAHLSILNASISIPTISLREDERIKDHAQRGRIPGAIFFDCDKLDLHDPLGFAKYLDDRGIHQHDFIVIYDNQGLLAASRAYWMLKSMRCSNVHIMNGTFGKWQYEERETNYFESEDLWHKVAADKKLKRREEFFGSEDNDQFDQAVEMCKDEFSLDQNFVSSTARISRIMRLNQNLRA